MDHVAQRKTRGRDMFPGNELGEESTGDDRPGVKEENQEKKEAD